MWKCKYLVLCTSYAEAQECSCSDGRKNWNVEAFPGDASRVLHLIRGADERSPTLSYSEGAETGPGWSRVCNLCDRSADAVISGSLGSEQRGPIILPCCDSKRQPQCSACWETGVSQHGLTGTVWSEASLGHSCGRIHLSSISSTRFS